MTLVVAGERGGDNDSYCDSEASMDDGSCYDNLEDVASPPPSDLAHQTLDLRHQDNVALRVSRVLSSVKLKCFSFYLLEKETFFNMLLARSFLLFAFVQYVHEYRREKIRISF